MENRWHGSKTGQRQRCSSLMVWFHFLIRCDRLLGSVRKACYHYQHKSLLAHRLRPLYCPALRACVWCSWRLGGGGLVRPHCFSYHIFTAYCVATLACLPFWWGGSFGHFSNPLKSLEVSNRRIAHLSQGEREEN